MELLETKHAHLQLEHEELQRRLQGVLDSSKETAQTMLYGCQTLLRRLDDACSVSTGTTAGPSAGTSGGAPKQPPPLIAADLAPAAPPLVDGQPKQVFLSYARGDQSTGFARWAKNQLGA